MQKRDVYKKKRIWAGVSPLANKAELEACLALRIPMLGGPAVAGLSAAPAQARQVDLQALPVKP